MVAQPVIVTGEQSSFGCSALSGSPLALGWWVSCKRLRACLMGCHCVKGLPLFLNAVHRPCKVKTNTVMQRLRDQGWFLPKSGSWLLLGSTVDKSRQIPFGYAYFNTLGRMRPCVWLLVIGARSKLPSIALLGKASLRGNLSLHSERKLQYCSMDKSNRLWRRLVRSFSKPSIDFRLGGYATVTMWSNGWSSEHSADLLLTPSFIYQDPWLVKAVFA